MSPSQCDASFTGTPATAEKNSLTGSRSPSTAPFAKPSAAAFESSALGSLTCPNQPAPRPRCNPDFTGATAGPHDRWRSATRSSTTVACVWSRGGSRRRAGVRSPRSRRLKYGWKRPAQAVAVTHCVPRPGRVLVPLDLPTAKPPAARAFRERERRDSNPR